MEEPFDVVSHGSHVTGIAISVAPEATWIAAKGCRDGQCLKYGLLKSAEFIACPTDRNGTNANCSMAADIVNNSWGNSQDLMEDFFAEVVKVWRQMGVIPVFANGNQGPDCGTATPPGNFANVIAVGATNIDDQLTKFSSRGPGPIKDPSAFVLQTSKVYAENDDSLFAWQKPDICAPGSKILSAGGRSDDHYEIMSGTSMASPVVSGVIGLWLSQFESRSENDFDKVYKALTQTAFRDLKQPDGLGGKTWPPFPWKKPRDTCGNTNYTDYPNMFYGFGRVDAKRALTAF
jgi:subtilisin family serine protease